MQRAIPRESVASLFPIGERKDYLEIDGSPVNGRIHRLQIVACGRRRVAWGFWGGGCGNAGRTGYKVVPSATKKRSEADT